MSLCAAIDLHSNNSVLAGAKRDTHNLTSVPGVRTLTRDWTGTPTFESRQREIRGELGANGCSDGSSAIAS